MHYYRSLHFIPLSFSNILSQCFSSSMIKTKQLVVLSLIYAHRSKKFDRWWYSKCTMNVINQPTPKSCSADMITRESNVGGYLLKQLIAFFYWYTNDKAFYSAAVHRKLIKLCEAKWLLFKCCTCLK